MNVKICVLAFSFFAGVVLLSGQACAQIGWPNQFYGQAITNGVPAPDGLIVMAKVGGADVAATATEAGTYGLSGGIFYVEDPLGNRPGETVELFLHGIKAGEAYFRSGESTEINFSVTGDFGVCGDHYCGSGENYSSCETDCEPHQFFGDVLVNNVSATFSVSIKTIIDGEEVANISSINGSYGIGEGNEFFIIDYDGKTRGKNIEFFVSDVKAGEYVFNNGGITDLTLSVSGDFGICGDNYCNNQEDCDSCRNDCGPCIPANPGSHGFYGIAVYDDGTLVQNNSVVTVMLNEIIVANTSVVDGKYGYYPSFYIEGGVDGDNLEFLIDDIFVINYSYDDGAVTKLDLIKPDVCGEGLCTGDESCSSCPGDCGTCPAPPDDSGSDSSGGPSGSTGGSYTPPAETCEENWTCTGWLECINGVQKRVCTDLAACGTNQSTPDGRKSCTPTAIAAPSGCNAGEMKCVGDNLMQCYDGNVWELVEECGYGCGGGVGGDSGTAACNPPSSDNAAPSAWDGITGFFAAGTGALYAIIAILVIIAGFAAYFKIIR